MYKGMMFNIQKSSIHDDLGIQATVFLKGCSLRCRWCSNPRSQLSKTQVLHDTFVCIQDSVCIQACPQRAVQRGGSHIVINDAQCPGCLRYITICKAKTLQVGGVCKDTDEVATTRLQGRDSYEESRSGVTLSGGEVLAQPSFAKAPALRLKQKGVHVAIGTTGYIQPAVFRKLAPLFDLLLLDVEHYDTEQYILGTGVNNDLMLENLTWDVKHQLCALSRILVTPGCNASLQDAKGPAALFTSPSIQQVQFLPFHQFDKKKYEMLSRDYGMRRKKALYPEDLRDYQ